MSSSPKEIINEVFVRSLFCETVYVTSLNLFSSTLYEFTNPDNWIWLLALIFFILLLFFCFSTFIPSKITIVEDDWNNVTVLSSISQEELPNCLEA